MSLSELITKEVVKVPLESATKVGVLRELVDCLHLAGRISDPERVYRALLEREELASTGLEMGVAIPHCKCDSVSDITIAVGVSPKGIDFDALDGEPARLFFLVVAAPNHVSSHIQILSEIGELSRSPAYIQSLMEAGSPEELVRRLSE